MINVRIESHVALGTMRPSPDLRARVLLGVFSYPESTLLVISEDIRWSSWCNPRFAIFGIQWDLANATDNE
jgi:hypothetical protein